MYEHILQEFLDSEITIISIDKLKYYIDFCLSHNTSKRIKGKTSLHHILPQAKTCFPEYSDLKLFPWNGAHLLYSDHFKAHSILCEAINNNSQLHAWYSMNNKDFASGKINPDDIISPETHSKLMERRSLLVSDNTRNTVIATEISTGKRYRVSKSDFDSSRDIYTYHTLNTVSVVDIRDNTRTRVSTDEFENSDYFITATNDRVTAIDVETSVKKQISCKEYTEGNFKTHRTGMVNAVRLADGETVFISVDEYQSNKEKYKFFTTGLVTARDLTTGKTTKVTKQEFDDNDNLVGVNYGREKRVRVYDSTNNIEKVIPLTMLESFLASNPNFIKGGRPKKLNKCII